GLTGAVCLAAEAAIRAGAGYATAAVPGGLEPIFEVKLTEVMTAGVGGDDARELSPDAVGAILDHCRGADAVIAGSGLGRGVRRGELVAALTLGIGAPLVLDADGLSATGTSLDPLRSRSAPTVLTPHSGEMGRLTGSRSAAVEARRLDSARDLARDTGTIVVLKGDDTIVTDGERVAINRLAAPGLATAGTGDVLSGVIAALLARRVDPFTAACAAVYAHARAGAAAADRVGSADGVIASDVITALPAALVPVDRRVK
ncbi:MAG: NAD(P)H-hydrate dehydratase, partial [Actinomycetota bacterium]|nr:NAD(P)H-hydrate dehydratase [Actinomycetota bacterium]